MSEQCVCNTLGARQILYMVLKTRNTGISRNKYGPGHQHHRRARQCDERSDVHRVPFGSEGCLIGGNLLAEKEFAVL